MYGSIAHGNEPYLLAANIGGSMDRVEVVIPDLYPGVERRILRAWFGGSSQIYLDEEGGRIFSRTVFRGDYGEYVSRTVAQAKSVEGELAGHLRDFEATSLAGKTRRFKRPDIEINAGSVVSTGAATSFFVFPGLPSEYAERCPVDVRDIGAFIKIAKDAEQRHRLIFVPAVNSFSYTRRTPHPREVQTPPLKREGHSAETLRRGILLTIPGSGVMADELNETAEKSGVVVYRTQDREDDKLQDNLVKSGEVIFNQSIIAVLARAGWGTLWLCQIAGKPIIAPRWRETDDPEIYHNTQTVVAMKMGVVYDNFSDSVLREALAQVPNIRLLSESIRARFGTLDGIEIVQQRMMREL